MQSQLFKHLLIAVVTCGLFAQALTSGLHTAAAQNPYIWDEPVKIKSVKKPGRVRRTTRPQPDKQGEEQAPLLTVKYRVLKRGDGNTQERVDPAGEFKLGDQLKLALTANQDGYLYVVHHSVGTDGQVIDRSHIIFPDPRINEGRNEVRKDHEYVVPGYCSGIDDAKDCWWEITPPNGRDYFTVIFSRDQITKLPSKLTEADLNASGDAVDQKVVDELTKASGQVIERANKIKFNSRRTTESDGIYVQNTNRKDNEELIERIELRHSGGEDNAAARTRALFVKKRADAMRVFFLKNGTPIDPSQEFKAGDEIEVKFQSNFKGYAYFVNITPSGKRCVIFPCSRTASNEMTPGTLYKQMVGFDEEPGSEVLQVILSRERVAFLADAIKNSDCCDPEKPCGCELSATASNAAAELASNSVTSRGGVTVSDVVPVVPQSGSSGVRARGIKLAAGRDKEEGSYVAIQDDKGNNRLETGQAAVFEIRLKHR
jgi:hypothetical protein